MVQHIVMFNLNDGVDKEETHKTLKAKFDELCGNVEGMESINLYMGYQGWDLCLISLHQSREAEQVYQNHPMHLEIKKLVAAVRKERASCDFEL